jgi:HIRAN domain
MTNTMDDDTRVDVTVLPTTKLIVTVRLPTGEYVPVGVLEVSERGSQFAYFSSAVARPDFQPLLGFADPKRRYQRPYLFPQFAERVISPSRPDRADYLETLNLGSDATPVEILGRSGGHRLNDPIELLPCPHLSEDGRTECLFLVHGVRHVPGASERIERLKRHEQLLLRPEPDNPVDRNAVQVMTRDGEALGWVPRPLLEYAHSLLLDDRISATVERANGAHVSPHLRLLARLRGWLPPGSLEPFTGPGWELMA